MTNVTLKYPSREVTLSEDNRGQFDIDDEMVLVTGTVKLADGTEHRAVFEVDTHSQGELCGTGIWFDGEMLWQGDEDFLSALSRTAEQVFPYKYKYDVPVDGDIHVGEDGWS